MRCSQFLQHYSDYRDGRVADAELALALADHVRTCPRCMRYDARVARGVVLLRSASDLTPSADFRRQLRHRLAREAALERAATEPVPAGRGGVMVALAVAAALLLVVWEAGPGRHTDHAPIPALTPAAETTTTPASRIDTSQREVTSFSVSPFGDLWHAPSATGVAFGGWPEVAP